MVQPCVPTPPQRKDDALVLARDGLGQALAADVAGQERPWALAVAEALARVETALRQHRAVAKAPEGLFAMVDETRPTLARQADGLRGDHDDILQQVLDLRKAVQRAAGALQASANPARRKDAGEVTDFGTIRQQAEQLLTGLQHNQDAETRLVLESVTTDIGVGD
jgi:hypothetical protein